MILHTGHDMNRRDFLRLLKWGALGAAASTGFGSLLQACSREPQSPGLTARAPGSTPDLELDLVAGPGEAQILPGRPTSVWRYSGELISGDTGALTSLPDSYLGPIIRVKQGQWVRVRLHNQVDQPTIVHWHGLIVPPDMDGHPMDVIEPGGEFLYDFQVRNRAGTYWFHPHPHTLTGPQVYSGLAGLFLVSDPEEQALGLPSGEFDLPLVIQDRTFDRSNQLLYLHNGMMDQMFGFLGDDILVNGQVDFTLSAARQPYRLRLLNGSNSRIYKLAWRDQTPLTVIATDDGLLEQPVRRPYVTLGPAERVELWVDFSRWEVGQDIQLVSLPFAGTGGGGSQLRNGSRFPVLTVKIDRDSSETSLLPEKLATIEHYSEGDSVNAGRPRTFELSMGGMGGMMRGGMSPTINGRVFEMEEVARDEVVRFETQETWLYDNTSSMGGMGMMGMQMAHPMHIHGVHFQVVDRQVRPGFREAWSSISEGYVDEGWKDTVLVMPGEQVKILLRFADYSGMYLQHCHILEHEDLGMMRNFRIDG